MKFHTCTIVKNKDGLFDGRIIPPDGCEKCKAEFESTKSHCPFCWQEVTNKQFLSSMFHQTGKCRTRTLIPIPEPRWKSPAQPINNLAALLRPMPDNTKWKPIKHKFFRGGKRDAA